MSVGDHFFAPTICQTRILRGKTRLVTGTPTFLMFIKPLLAAFAALSVGATCSHAAPIAAPLPLENADFESGARGWTRRYARENYETVVVDPDDGANHVGQIRFAPNDAPALGATAYFARTGVAIAPETSYRVSFRARSDLKSGTAGPHLILQGGGKTLLSLSHSGKGQLPEISGVTPWKTLTLDFVSPPGAQTLLLQLNATKVEGTVWFDDLKIETLGAAEQDNMKPIEPAPNAAKRAREAAKRDELAAVPTVPVPAHPFLFADKSDIARARERVQNIEWDKATKERVIANSQLWLDRSYAEIAALIPPRDAIYIYGLGYNLDPVKRQRMKWRGWSDPHHVESADGVVYPNAQTPDDGAGWVDPKSGQQYYFTGMANGAIMTALTFRVLPDLADAYALTGDRKYAERALWILDGIATIYPTSEDGPLDYPGGAIGKPGGGRLERPYYQAARALLKFAYAFDMVADDELARQDSPSNPGLTIARNIELNLLMNGANYCLETVRPSRELNNGVIDYNSGILAVGAVLGVPSYVDWALNGPLGFRLALANTIDADGRYYETSPGYSKHTRGLLLSSAQLLRRMRLPGYPQGYNAYDDARFRRFALGLVPDLEVAGRLPSFGDAGPDRIIVTKNDDFDEGTLLAAGQFILNSTQPATRREALQAAYRTTSGQPMATDDAQWDLYHAPDWSALFADATLKTAQPAPRATLFHENGVFVLRAGQELGERAALLRYGPTLNHGHADELALQFYALGREFSGDPGYYNTHYRFGFNSQTVSHNTVVVNRMSQLAQGAAGGDLLNWNAGAVLRSAEVEDSAAYRAQKVSEYHRRVALIDIAPGESYIVDTFWLRGGRDYDYSLHGLLESDFKILSPQNLTLQEKRGGSVLSPDISYKLTADHRVESFPRAPFYFAPPGQGYGFLSNPAFYQPGGPLELQWSTKDATQGTLYVTHFAPPGAQIIVAESPHPVAPVFETTYLLSRVAAAPTERVRYASVIRPTRGADKIARVEELAPAVAAPALTALRIVPRDAATAGEQLYFADADGTQTHKFAGDLSFAGREGFLRRDADGKIRAASLVGAGELKSGGFRFTVAPLSAPLPILEIQRAPLRLRVAGVLPPEKMADALIRISPPGVARPMAMRIVSARVDGQTTWLQFDADSEIVSAGTVTGFDAATQTLTTDAPFSRARPYVLLYDPITGLPQTETRPQTVQYNGAFDGYRVQSSDDPKVSGIVRNLTDERTKFQLSGVKGAFAKGAKFEIAAFGVGDHVEIPAWAQAERDANGNWKVSGPAVAIASRQ